MINLCFNEFSRYESFVSVPLFVLWRMLNENLFALGCATLYRLFLFCFLWFCFLWFCFPFCQLETHQYLLLSLNFVDFPRMYQIRRTRGSPTRWLRGIIAGTKTRFWTFLTRFGVDRQRFGGGFFLTFQIKREPVGAFFKMSTSDCPGGNRDFNINSHAQQIVQSIAICKH